MGQGDATLISLGREHVLVDGGRARNIVLVLADYQVDSLVAVVASHNHADHISGLVAVVADYPVGRFYGNGRSPANATAEELEEWLSLKGVARPPPPWPPVVLGDDVTVRILRPPPVPTASENNSSLGVIVQRGPFRALLTGDSEHEELVAWLETGIIPDVDVLKAAHHGARNGITPGWIQRSRPEVVVISVGAGNGYGHPDAAALRYYGYRGSTIYRTDRDGTVSVVVDSAGTYHVIASGPTVR
ncbi:MAG: ComEC/Rec2 family competence protein [Gemmatimonadales bacterium]